MSETGPRSGSPAEESSAGPARPAADRDTARPERRSALAGHVTPGESGAVGGDGPGVALGERRLTAIVQLDGAPPEAELDRLLGGTRPPPARLGACAAGGDLTLLWSGPGQWLLVPGDASPEALRARIESALEGTGATLTDLTQARTVINVRGFAARDLLAKGCPLDVDALAPGFSSATVLGHFGIQLHCRGDDDFDIYVFRSFGLALWEWLVEQAQEFGCAVAGPA